LLFWYIGLTSNSKRQLTRKLNEWRFRKNTRAVERQYFLLNESLSFDESLGATTGIKVTNTKIERWKRGSTKEATGEDSEGRSNLAPGEQSLLHFHEMADILVETYNDEPTLPTEISHSQVEDSLNFEDDCPIADVLLERNDMSWPFSSNSDDPGPVFLSRLFSALSITPPADLNSYAMRFPKPETLDLAESQHLSSTQYDDLTSGNNTSQALVLGGHRMLKSAVRQSASPSPFNEICLFSPFEPNRLTSSHTQRRHHLKRITVDQHRILELEERLSKLQGLLPETHPVMFAILQGLFDANISLANFKLAEHWCRRIITIRQNLEGIHSPQSLLDQVHLIQALSAQGRTKEAKELHDQLYSDIKRNDLFICLLTRESLAAEYLEAQFDIAQDLGSNRDSAASSNQLVQLRLSTLGPYDEASLGAMKLVAESLLNLGIYDESIRILRLMLQLQERFSPSSYQRRCIGIRVLAKALRSQKHYGESVTVARRSVELAEEFLGSEHQTTLLNTTELGLCLYQAGLLSESEAVFRSVVAKRISKYGENHFDSIFEMGNLGGLLMKTGNYEEATTWYEKAFRRLLEVSGWRHGLAMEYCGLLGKCYEKQGRYIDGIALFEQALQENQWLKETRSQYYCLIYELAECYLQEGRAPEAISVCRNALHDIGHKLPEDQDWERWISDKLAEGYKLQQQYYSAAAIYEQIIAKIRGTELWDYEWCWYYCRSLGGCYENLERYCDALALYERSQEEIWDLKGPDHSVVGEIQGLIDVVSNKISNTEIELDVDEDGTLGNEEDD
jgi:tetratricopeptide (TPR) repeat protein